MYIKIYIYFCPDGIQPCNMKKRHLLKKIQDTKNIVFVHRTMTPQCLRGRNLWTSHSSPNCHQLPYFIFLNLINGLKSLPFQR